MPAFITLSQAKLQLGLFEEETDDDELIQSFIDAASELVEADLNRKVYLTQDALNADENAPVYAIVTNKRIEQATKLLATHWFNNREATSELTIKTVPLAYDHLINSLRIPVA